MAVRLGLFILAFNSSMLGWTTVMSLRVSFAFEEISIVQFAPENQCANWKNNLGPDLLIGMN